MTLTLDVSEATGRRLADEAHLRGISIESIAIEKIEQGLPLRPSPESRLQAVAVLQSFIDDPDEPDDGYDLLKALDDNRLPGERKLFPPEMKGISW